MDYIRKIALDFNAQISPLTVAAKQSDSKSRYLLIEPLLDGKVIDMKGITVVFCAEKPDGKSIINYCTIDENGNIFVELTSQTLAVSGIIKCEIKLYQDLSVLSSCPFCIEVVESVNDSGIESSDEFTVLTDLINQCKEMLKAANVDMEQRYIFLPKITEIKIKEAIYEEKNENE